MRLVKASPKKFGQPSRAISWLTLHDGSPAAMNIALSSDALDVSFHPGEQVHKIAVGLISGKVQVFDYSAMFNEDGSCQSPPEGKRKSKLYKRLWSVRPSHKSCRGVAFDASGDKIYCIFKDKSLLALDAATGEVLAKWANAHEYVLESSNEN